VYKGEECLREKSERERWVREETEECVKEKSLCEREECARETERHSHDSRVTETCPV
jgi:hypothetical protein